MKSRVFFERDKCCVWIKILEDGSLRLSGQDLAGWNGADEYEYWITVQSKDFGLIRDALGGAADADIEELMCANAEMIYSSGEQTWLRSIGVEPDFSSYF